MSSSNIYNSVIKTFLQSVKTTSYNRESRTISSNITLDVNEETADFLKGSYWLCHVEYNIVNLKTGYSGTPVPLQFLGDISGNAICINIYF